MSYQERVDAPAPEPQRSVTEHGFDTFDEFRDTYGRPVAVRESSAASGPHVWIFGTDLHLDIEGAKRVRAALDTFLSEVPERWVEPEPESNV